MVNWGFKPKTKNYTVQIKCINCEKTGEIEKILGYKYSDEVIHRDDLAVVSKKNEK